MTSFAPRLVRSALRPSLVLAGALLAIATPLRAQAPTPPPAYGPNITLETARKVVAAASTEARRNGWNVAIAIVDTGGHLVLLERMDNTQIGSIAVAQKKAWTSVAYKRPTKQFEDAVAGGGTGLRVLANEGVLPIDGGLPIVVGGQIVGAIGVSGVQATQDAVVAQAGLAALK